MSLLSPFAPFTTTTFTVQVRNGIGGKSGRSIPSRLQAVYGSRAARGILQRSELIELKSWRTGPTSAQNLVNQASLKPHCQPVAHRIRPAAAIASHRKWSTPTEQSLALARGSTAKSALRSAN
jgi:hypothetical protein